MENKYFTKKVVIYMNVFLYKKKNDKKQSEDIFQKELKRFADDYGLTIEEAVTILVNMAAKQMKEAVLLND